MAKLLEYTPEARLGAVEAMCHPLFDELRVEGMRMPNGKALPRLFDFTREGGLFNHDCEKQSDADVVLAWLLYLYIFFIPLCVRCSATLVSRKQNCLFDQT